MPSSLQVYAVVTGGLSAVTCIAYFVPFVLRMGGIFAVVWDAILFVLWIALFGLFGRVSYRLTGIDAID